MSETQHAISSPDEIPAELREHIDTPAPAYTTYDHAACPAHQEGREHRSHMWRYQDPASRDEPQLFCQGIAGMSTLMETRAAREAELEAYPQRYVIGPNLDDEQTEPMDMLRQIFSSQEYFQDLLGNDPAAMSDAERVMYLKDQILALTDEAHEALNEIGWKPWATSRHINSREFAGELVDILCFLINLALGVGLTPTEFFKLHEEKAQRNIQRQIDKYDGVTGKCPQCNRALDDLTAKGIKLPHPILDGNIQMCSAACITEYNFQTKEKI